MIRINASLAILALFTALSVQPVQAQSADAARVLEGQQATRDYFAGEKRGAIGFAAFGGASLAAGGLMALSEDEALVAASIPTLALGLVDLIIGVAVYSVADGRAERLVGEAGEDFEAYRRAEIERIGLLDTTFLFLYAVEAAIVLGGVGSAIYGNAKGDDTFVGVGLGLAVQAAALLILDGFADHRGELYLKVLDGPATSSPSGAQIQGGLIGFSGQF